MDSTIFKKIWNNSKKYYTIEEKFWNERAEEFNRKDILEKIAVMDKNKQRN